MSVLKFFSIAYRNLIRNGRRTSLTALAVALGLVVTMMMSSLIAGMTKTMVADGIRVSTGHLQVLASSREEGEARLLASDLLENPAAWSAQAKEMPEVRSAAPILRLGGLLSTSQESIGIEILGIRAGDAYHQPIRDGIVTGSFFQDDARRQILLGRGLADQMGIGLGQRVSVAITDARGANLEGIFTVVGLVDTGFPSLDQHRVLLPLSEAQTFSGVGNRFSSLILMLHDGDDTAAVAGRFSGADTKVRTWEELNSLILESVETGLIFYYVLYVIVFLAVAVIIANTLLMSVFARAREIGILAALGMKRRQITLLFLIEGSLLALLGIALGLVLGLGGVAYMTFVGFSIPAETVALVEGFTIGTRMRGGFAPGQFAILSLLLLAIVTLVSFYPASLAARMQPVEALHSH